MKGAFVAGTGLEPMTNAADASRANILYMQKASNFRLRLIAWVVPIGLLSNRLVQDLQIFSAI